MKYEECKTLADVAQALNDDESPCFDICAYQAAIERVGAVYIPEGTYWARIDRGGGVYDVLARIGICGPFCVYTVNECDLGEDALAELRLVRATA